jgi:hypothetical protein
VAATTQVRLLVRTICFMSRRLVLGAGVSNVVHMPFLSGASSIQYLLAAGMLQAGVPWLGGVGSHALPPMPG